jgi:hypothetical protein
MKHQRGTRSVEDWVFWRDRLRSDAPAVPLTRYFDAVAAMDLFAGVHEILPGTRPSLLANAPTKK